MRKILKYVSAIAGATISSNSRSACPGSAVADDASLRADGPPSAATWPILVAALILLGACQLPDADNLRPSRPDNAAAAVIPTGPIHAHAGSKVTLLYISARDCPPCARWATAASGNGWISERQFTAMPETAQIDMRTITAQTFRRTSLAKDWPDDLRWVTSATFVAAGAPRYVLLLDGVVVANVNGLRRFTSEIVPAIQRLVKEKTA